MKRKSELNSVTLPDAINCSLSRDFTQIPNATLRDSQLTLKAKGLLCLLLSNKEGWRSHLKTLIKMSKDGRDSIQSGLNELEDTGYLIRIKYRDITTKKFGGVLWAYTDIPNQFFAHEQLEYLKTLGFEPQPGFPVPVFPAPGNPPLKILNNKNINILEEDSKEAPDKLPKIKRAKYITPELFDLVFWSNYPKKTDEGKAKSKWNEICRLKSWEKDKPTIKQIKTALKEQKKSDRWKKSKYIPLPTTWLNNMRWLDDPSQMISYSNTQQEPSQSPTSYINPTKIIGKFFFMDPKYAHTFYKNYYQAAKELLGTKNKKNSSLTASNLVEVYKYINKYQNDIAARKGAPSPGKLIDDYIFWLSNQNWISNITPKSFSIQNSLFEQFKNKKSKEMGFDIITGQVIN